jgi:hypothetical protein
MRYSGTGAMETPTFIIPSELDMPGYQLLASPSLYPGQTVFASVQSALATSARLFIRVYADGDETVIKYGDEITVAPGKPATLTLRVPESDGNPVVTVGVEARASGENVLYLDYLTWDGEPNVTFTRPVNAETKGGEAWRRAWVLGVDQWESHWRQAYRLAQNRGRGLLIQGTREWRDYETEATLKISMAKAAGIAARVQGMERYYALLACDDGNLRLIKRQDGETVLGETPFDREGEKAHQFKLCVKGARIAAWIDGLQVFDVNDANDPLTGGAIAFVIEEGHMMSDEISVR